MTTHQLLFKSLIIDVTGTYYKGGIGEWGTLPDPAEFEIEEVTANGLQLNEVFEDDMVEIERLIIETHYS